MPNLDARDIPKSIMLNTFSLAYMVIKMTVPNMVRKENGKGIMYEITTPTAKYMKSRIND
ncbi:MAG TPA: hypothetical protein VF233_10205 [Nitrososphaeraceae archaeon]|nr:hypothetical protein [Thermoproteota archaeon]